jgi:hypothetical protein
MAMTGKTAAAILSCLVLAGCAGQDAITHLAPDLSNVGTIEIIHARFPCFSPDFHLYGYRFRVTSKTNKWSYGDICWDFSRRQWTWVMLPGHELSHLTPRLARHPPPVQRRGAAISAVRRMDMSQRASAMAAFANRFAILLSPSVAPLACPCSSFFGRHGRPPLALIFALICPQCLQFLGCHSRLALSRVLAPVRP